MLINAPKVPRAKGDRNNRQRVCISVNRCSDDPRWCRLDINRDAPLVAGRSAALFGGSASIAIKAVFSAVGKQSSARMINNARP